MSGRAPRIQTFERAVATLVRSTGASRLVTVDQAVRAVEFGLVGLSGAAVNAALFLAFVTNDAYLVTGMLAFWLAVAWTFGGNWLLTFDETRDQLLQRFGRYVAVCALGYVLYTSVLVAAIEVGHLAYPVAVLAAIGTAGVWNFVGAERFAMDP